MSHPAQQRCSANTLLMFLVALAIAPAQAQHYVHGISVEAWAQIEAIQREKSSWTPSQQKVEFKLLMAAKAQAKQAVVDGMPALRDSIELDAKGLTRVDIRVDVSDELLDAIRAVNGVVETSHAAFNAICAKLPLDAVQLLAERDDVQWIRAAREPISNKVNSTEGDVAHRVDLARQAFGVDGTGVKIGVLSDNVSASVLLDLQSSGDLPNVTIVPGQAGSGVNEGSAMLEIVHDLAPGASLYFATATTNAPQFAANIHALQAAGCSVIVDDIFYFDEPVFQDGIIAQAVESVAALDVAYFSSAGNSGNLNDGTSGVYEGDFAGVAGPVSIGGVVHDFGGGQNYNIITDDTANGYTLHWSDEMTSSSNDYDLYLLNASRTTIWDSSVSTQNGSQQPYEFISSLGVNDVGNTLVVVKFNGADRFIHLNTIRGGLGIGTAGQTNGHACTDNSFCIASVDHASAGGAGNTFDGSESVEVESSDGPRRVFFEADGTPYTPGNFSSNGGVVRNKPDLTAADGVSTATPGFETFFGTSAAAPHAAAIAALLIDKGIATTPAAIRTALTSTAIDIEAPGYDRDSGFGIIDAIAALSHGFGSNDLVMLFPAGGDSWRIGKKQRIEWFSIGATGANVTLKLLRNGGVVQTIAGSTRNDGLLKWRVPANIPTGKGYKVRVTSIADPGAADSSDGNFRIRPAK